MKLPPPNRVAVYLTAASGLLAAVAVPIANLDIQSTAGVIGGLGTILAVTRKWLDGWQAHEATLSPVGDEDGQDGDNDLDQELANRPEDSPPPDEVDGPEQTQPREGDH